MITLAIESAARICSVALVDDKNLICEMFSDSGLTHSQTLMKMVDMILSISKVDFSSVNCIAVSIGPGSYTGIRIGIAAAKGLAQPGGLKCFGVSTLEAMAYNLLGLECIVCAVMDARCAQAYTALFKCERDCVLRLTPDKAMPIAELCQILDDISVETPVILVGDGAKMFFELYAKTLTGISIAPKSVRFQHAYAVALTAASVNQGQNIPSAEMLAPVYLRAPQAERELKKERNIL